MVFRNAKVNTFRVFQFEKYSEATHDQNVYSTLVLVIKQICFLFLDNFAPALQAYYLDSIVKIYLLCQGNCKRILHWDQSILYPTQKDKKPKCLLFFCLKTSGIFHHAISDILQFSRIYHVPQVFFIPFYFPLLILFESFLQCRMLLVLPKRHFINKT